MHREYKIAIQILYSEKYKVVTQIQHLTQIQHGDTNLFENALRNLLRNLVRNPFVSVIKESPTRPVVSVGGQASNISFY